MCECEVFCVNVNLFVDKMNYNNLYTTFSLDLLAIKEEEKEQKNKKDDDVDMIDIPLTQQILKNQIKFQEVHERDVEG